MLKRTALSLCVALVFLLHQDVWNWTRSEPLIFGFLPLGLAYHAGYAVLAAVLMAALVKFAWPAALDQAESGPEDRDGASKP